MDLNDLKLVSNSSYVNRFTKLYVLSYFSGVARNYPVCLKHYITGTETILIEGGVCWSERRLERL